MHLLNTIDEIRSRISKEKQLGKSVGLVPTMGALHEGHLSLVRAARACDVVVVSIFVNPLQFNNAKDLEAYPSNLEMDVELIDKDADVVFAPDYTHIYPSKPSTSIQFGESESNLEGAFRPGHFGGVGIVVSKLFNIIEPDRAYFGLKDLQQFFLIKQLVRDLSFPIEIVGCPTVREPSGLAMSSRNKNLSEESRSKAAKLFEGLKIVKNEFDRGTCWDKAKNVGMLFYQEVGGLSIEYLECTSDDLGVLDQFPESGNLVVCVAAQIDGVRLIDNLYLRSEKEVTSISS